MIVLDFTKEEIDHILDKCGYVTEDVLAFFPSDCRQDLNINPSYSSMHILVAYKKGERPKELEGERVYCDDISNYEYSKILTKLVKNKILSLF